MNKFYSHLINSRPYSWGDLLLLGYLAKVTAARRIDFGFSDLWPLFGLLALWIFYNLALEIKHRYDERGKIIPAMPLMFLSIGFLPGLKQNHLSKLIVIILTILILVYINKGKNKYFALSSPVVRGLIQVNYYLYAVVLFHSPLKETAIISLLVFLLYFSRAIVGDIRDIKHNAVAGKITIPVVFGVKKSKSLALFLIALSIIIELIFFHSFFPIIPLLVFIFALFVIPRGYILHQLNIITTIFFSAFLIDLMANTDSGLILTAVIFFSIFLNLAFYPAMPRKSNPVYVN